jgi:hypothetical protein
MYDKNAPKRDMLGMYSRSDKCKVVLPAVAAILTLLAGAGSLNMQMIDSRWDGRIYVETNEWHKI